jgi:TPR repeat protein
VASRRRQYWLGTLYARGRGVPEDESQALHWYEAAAKAGNNQAMHRLGVAYFEGQGVEKNDTEAARWFNQAAELGNIEFRIQPCGAL